MAMPSRCAQADEIGFELGEGGEDIEEHLPHGIARIVEGLSEAGSGVGGPGEAVIGVDAILDDAKLQERWAARSCRSVEQRAYPMSVLVMGELYG